MSIGLTGGIAAGKSQVETFLRDLGIPVLDTDKVAHDVMRAGSPVHAAIVDRFGTGILAEDGEIHRPALARIVFQDAAARQDLNARVHPETGRRWRAWRDQQTAPLVGVSIPLLFECGLENEFQGILCVRASEETMKQRLKLRGLTEAQAEQRIQSQWPVDKKAAASTWVLENDGSLEDLHAQVLRWHQSLNRTENSPHV